MSGNSGEFEKLSLNKRKEKLSPNKRELLELLLKEKRARQKLSAARGIARRKKADFYPLSFSQQRLWFLDKLEPGNPNYTVTFCEKLTGPLNIETLAQSLTQITSRHEALRTAFITVEGKPVQIIASTPTFNLPVIDLGQLPEHKQTIIVRQLAAQEVHQAFDLSKGPLLRATLLRLRPSEHVLLMSMHHIVCDGWSTGVLLKEMATLYESSYIGNPSPLEELPIQYADFAVWQRERLQGQVLDELLSYWKKRLQSPIPVIELPTDRPRPAGQFSQGASQFLLIHPELVGSLQALSLREHATLFMTLFAAFEVLLYRYTGQEDLIVGTPIANRNSSETQGLIGLFINMLVLRTELSGSLTFLELLRHVKEVCLGAYDHQDLPFEKLVEELKPERDVSRHPLFQIMLVLQSTSNETLRLGKLTLSPLTIESETAQVDLSLFFIEQDGGLLASIDYATDLFDAATISQMLTHLHVVLASLLSNPKQRLDALPLLTDAELHEILVGRNDTGVEYATTCYIHHQFELHACESPDAIAVIFEGECLTYAELNRRANQLAHYLRRFEAGPEVVIGVYLERSFEMVIALLAILKAGSAYVPFDPSYPKERLAYMLENAQPPLLLTGQRLKSTLPEYEGQVISIDTDWQKICGESSANPSVPVTDDNLAYVIYTSGSTGTPKGAMNTHRGIRNRLLWMQDAYRLTDSDSVLQKTPYSFDVSVWEFFWPLMTGARMILAKPGGHQDAAYMVKLIMRHRITTMHFVPSMLQVFLNERGVEACESLKRVIASGEALPLELQRRFRNKLNAELHNLYGPTEAAVDVTFWKCDHENNDRSVPIGRPVANTQIYIFDPALQPVPTRVGGELHIGGLQLARGYIGKPDLTAGRFIPNPHGTEPGARLYKTGDFTRYLPDNSIEFMGRIDTQVKIRGVRIELGEIEAVLEKHDGVRQSVVAARDDVRGNKSLIAYVVAEKGMTTDQLRAHSKQRLPDQMIPSAFVLMDELPLLPSGKVNRKALPDPAAQAIERETAYMPPRNKVEKIIASVWQDVLHVEGAGANDNFFDLGGHSLLLAEVSNRLEALFGREISIITLFKYPTISALASHIASDSKEQTDFNITEAVKIHDISLDRRGTEVAIIGMAGRFPGARNVEQFWLNLRDGIESITPFSDEELEASGVDVELLSQPNYVKAGTLIEDIDLFDASFFGFNPRDAEITDPQHRVFLECAYEAMENAGYPAINCERPVGVFAGVTMSTYLMHLYSNRNLVKSVNEFQAMIGNDKDHLPTLVSYKLNLRGPSVAVQTACSTSLVAVHMACQSLLNGECFMALAGGASISVPQKEGYLYQEGGIQSPDGHCRAFDARAQGTVAGAGVGIIVLKKLNDALADGDNILAVIKGTAINNDGSLKVGYTAPSVKGQAEVIARAQAIADINPETVSYVEAHGTGTPLGDPIEVEALTQVFRASTQKKKFCAIGSVKTNIGHLDAAAGIAGLIKTVLALNHKLLPPSLHFQEPNPKIDFDNSPFYVNAKLTDWNTSEQVRRAGVSSFGIGGTNAHVIVEEAPPRRPATIGRPWQLILLSAKTRSALDAATDNLVDFLNAQRDVNLEDAAYTLQVGRAAYTHRRMVVCNTVEDAAAALKTPQRVFTFESRAGDRNIVFMFSGQGTQHVNMARGLYESEPVFKQHVDQCCEMLKTITGIDLRELLYPAESEIEDATRQLNQTYLTQPALFLIEYALAKMWWQWGVRPQAMIGHSIGEYVAACIAGVFSLEDALKLVATRGRLMQELPSGAMLGVSLSEPELKSLLGKHLSIAAVNGPSLCVVSGPGEAVAELEDSLLTQGITCRRLHTSHAFHSPMMAPVMDEFANEVVKVNLNAPELPYISNVTGNWITPAEATNPAYWSTHLRHTVRFSEGLNNLLRESDNIFLEIGPGQTLATLVRRHPDKRAEQVVLSSLGNPRKEETDEAFMSNTLGRLWLAGVKVDWSAFHAERRHFRVPLPTYNFERQRYWIDAHNQFSKPGARQMPLSKEPDIADWFYIPSWKRSFTPEPFERGAISQERKWLVLDDGLGLGAKLVEWLEAEQGQNVTRVIAGERHNQIGNRVFTINPSQPDDYEELIKLLRSIGEMPEAIIHLWGVTRTPEIDSEDHFASSLEEGFYSLIYLAQALAKQDAIDRIDLLVVSNNAHDVSGQENICAAKAMSLAACKVIVQEMPNIKCRNIDIEIATLSGAQEERLVEDLLAEAFAKDAELVVAYRGKNRWVQEFEHIDLKAGIKSKAALKQAGVYVFTGRLTKIALALAEYLARTLKARLVLISSEDLHQKNESDNHFEESSNDEMSEEILLKKLKILGAEVEVLKADLWNEQEMRRTIRQVFERYGQINGVIHAAGIDEDEAIIPLDRLSKADCERQFRAKAYAVEGLAKALEGMPLDFGLLMSSISAVLGGLGFAAHSASNIFLDAYAQKLNQGSGTRWVSINWDAWLEEDFQTPAERANFGLSGLALTANEATQAFERIISKRDLYGVVVSTSSLEARIDQWLRLRTLHDGERPAHENQATLHAIRTLQNEYVPPRDDLERTITEIWQDLLGVRDIGIHDNFIELGGHSLLAIHLISRLRDSLRVELPMRALFDAPTVASLSDLIKESKQKSQEVNIPPLVPVSRDAYRVKALSQTGPGVLKTARVKDK